MQGINGVVTLGNIHIGALKHCIGRENEHQVGPENFGV
jgi:hypothetical protein